MRNVSYRKQSILLWVTLIAIASVVLIIKDVHASDYKQDGQGHTIIYTITDSSGDPVVGQSPRVAAKRMTDGLFYDWSDGQFKLPSAVTTLFQTMTYEATGGFYYRIISIDNSALVSMDVITIVSNDDAIYGDTQSENISWDNLNNLIKIHR